VLERKGYVKHRSEGRAFVYRAAVSRSEARRSALRRLLAQFFDGSPEALAQHLLREHEVDLDELDTLQREVDRARKGGRS
jgi:predicted transcriptional regulator